MGARVTVINTNHLLDILRKKEQGVTFLISSNARIGQQVMMWRLVKQIPKAFGHPGGGRIGIKVVDMATDTELSFEENIAPCIDKLNLYYLPDKD